MVVSVKAEYVEGKLVAKVLPPVSKAVITKEILPPKPTLKPFKTPLIPKPVRIWDNKVEVGRVRRADTVYTRIEAATKDGVRYVTLRDLYWSTKHEAWLPRKTGINLPVIYPIEMNTTQLTPFDDIIKMALEAKEVALQMPLADATNAVYIIPKRGR